MNRGQLVKYLPDLMKYYNKLTRWEELRSERIKRQQEILDAVTNGKKPPRKLPKQDLYIKGEGKPELPKIEELEDLTRAERLFFEKKTLGVYFTGHPLDDYPDLLKKYEYTIKDLLEGKVSDKTNVSLPVIISSLVKKCSKKKQNYGILVLEDCTGRIESAVFPKTWTNLEAQLEEGKIIIAHGRINKTEQDEGKPIIKFVLNKVGNPHLEENTFSNLEYQLSDGTKFVFIPNKKSVMSIWNFAKNYINNLKGY